MKAPIQIRSSLVAGNVPVSLLVGELGINEADSLLFYRNPTGVVTSFNLAGGGGGGAPINSPVFTGDPRAPTPSALDNDTSIATTAFVTTAITGKADTTTVTASLALKADLASPTFTGDPKAPTPTAGDNDTSIATTAFVQTALASKADTSALTAKADLASPTFTGDPKAPTPATGDNDTSIATTAFVKAQSYLTSADLSTYAPLASPALTGNPTAPTATAGDNDTSIATTAFVQAAAASAAGAVVHPPQGRLTLVAGTPVMTTSQVSKGTVYYTPYVGQFAPLYDGTKFIVTDLGGELSQAVTDTTKSPAAVVLTKNYDMFLWDDAGTKRCTRGPAWSSDTVRGTGAGTTELEMVTGILVNKNAITNGPAARRGTYVGSIRAHGDALVWYQFGSLAAGGGYAHIGVWNCYNRTHVKMLVQDTTASWTYTAAVWRYANGNSAWGAYFISGLAEDAWAAKHFGLGGSGSGAFPNRAIGYDSSTSYSGSYWMNQQLSAGIINDSYFSTISLGYHFAAAIEFGGTGIGFNGAQFAGLSFDWRC